MPREQVPLFVQSLHGCAHIAVVADFLTPSTVTAAAVAAAAAAAAATAVCCC